MAGNFPNTPRRKYQRMMPGERNARLVSIRFDHLAKGGQPISQQARNKRSSRLVIVDGQQMNFTDACELKGVNRRVVSDRMAIGWTFDEAVTRRVRSKNI
jgi:hypothetical protein